MGDILKEAIADAKAVRETALENAKMALEEAFTPQIKSMLSAKLKEEEDDDKEEGMHDEGEHDDAEEGRHEEGEHDDEAEEGEHEEGMREDDEDEAEEGRHDAEEGMHDEGEHEEGEHEEGMHDEDDDMEEDLDLEAVIKELEAELSEGEDDDVEEKEDDAEEGRGMKEEEEIEEEYEIDEAALEEDEDTVEEELDKSSGIGKGDNKEDNTDVSSGIGKGKTGMKESALEAELNEYKEAVSFLKDKLHEVNILNAKLLFTNKLFKQYSLDNNQKLKVVETFDRAQTTREIKLVYSTLAEQFGDNGSINRKSINESASSKTGSTKPSKESRKVISEEAQVANRFKKLAGLIK